jgi:hypothetical protein
MKLWTATALFAGGLLVGCMAGGPATTAQPSSPAPPARPAAPRAGSWEPAPLLIDRNDLRMGLTVQFRHVPDVTEIADLRGTTGLAHLVLALPEWPSGVDQLESLAQVPPEADVIVVLKGYPPSREAAQAWNLVSTRLRIVLVVTSPPPSQAVVGDLNDLRGLERVIAEVEPPSRAGFEQLQRPLSFRRVVE